MNKARFITNEDLIVMPFKCRIDEKNYCALMPTTQFTENYDEPTAYLDGHWCVIKMDSKMRWYGDPENPEDPRHPEETE